jgi:hypothetical protein
LGAVVSARWLGGDRTLKVAGWLARVSLIPVPKAGLHKRHWQQETGKPLYGPLHVSDSLHPVHIVPAASQQHWSPSSTASGVTHENGGWLHE